MTDLKEISNKEEWVGKEVLCYKWEEYHGFIPKHKGFVINETDEECEVRVGIFGTRWMMKKNGSQAQIVGSCKLIK